MKSGVIVIGKHPYETLFLFPNFPNVLLNVCITPLGLKVNGPRANSWEGT